MKSAPVQYLQYLHISTRIYTARRRGSLGRLHCNCRPGRRRRGLAENNKYHFLPPRTGALALAGEKPAWLPRWGSRPWMALGAGPLVHYLGQ